MSSSLNPTKLFQLSIQHDRHRLRINSIKSQSSPLLRKQKQQISLMSSRHAHQQYNFHFKTKQNSMQIQKKNVKILDKLQNMSRVKTPVSAASDRLRNSMVLNRSASKNQVVKQIEKQNERFVKKLFNAKSVLSQQKMRSSYHQHLNRSQMLSKFKMNERGKNIPKSQSAIQRRIKLEPVHKKLKILQSKVHYVKQVKIQPSPIKFNSLKLLKMNPQRKW